MSNSSKSRVTTALLLAAGTGSRLKPLTIDKHKCLTMLHGASILERLLACLNHHKFKRLIVVTGYLDDSIREFLGDEVGDVKIEYIFCSQYKDTNNIYSLWMARKVISESFLLLECDLVFDKSMLNEMIYPDKMAVAQIEPWMNGTCITINESKQITSFLKSNEECSVSKYKTVNIYSISLDSWRTIEKKLENHISEGKVNDYYEIVFAEMLSENTLAFDVAFFDNKYWYEIDTIKDLEMAEEVFLEAAMANKIT